MNSKSRQALAASRRGSRACLLLVPAVAVICSISAHADDKTWDGDSSQGSFGISGSTLTWTAVPEPTSALAGMLLGVGMLRRRRTGADRSIR